ncbi:MAG TPA: hypothetical protein VEQ63_12515 [Bryobacteraceae bacterium]|nr:hypothetical protein [Bryobacteraceae bacterium]
MRLAAVFLLAVAIFASNTQPRITRNQLLAMEKVSDDRVVHLDSDEPGSLLGLTRGVYLEDYGAVFTAEVDLTPGIAPNPFRPNKPDLQKIKAKKQNRIIVLKQRMIETLVASAGPLDSLPLDKKVALAVTIAYYHWEDVSGLPRQILIEAPRRVLVKGAAGDMAAVQKAVKVQEF